MPIHAQVMPPAAAQTAEHNTDPPDPDTKRQEPAPISLTIAGIVDGGGHDRYSMVVLRRRNWLLENINWVDRSGTDAISLFLAGRRLHLARSLSLTVLAGPWYEYANHAWDEAVIDSNVEFERETFRFVSVNHWGVALRRTGEFFDSHAATAIGIPGLPRWLGVNGQIEHSSAAFEKMWAGPMFTKHVYNVSFNGVPYWDFLHHGSGVRITLAYQKSLSKPRNGPD